MKQFNLLLTALCALIFTACSEDEGIIYSVEVDAYYRGISLEGKVKYAPVLLAKFNDKTATLAAVDGNDKKLFLEPYWNQSSAYRWVPDTASYSENIEKEQTYKFTAVPARDSEKKIEKEDEVNITGVPKEFKIITVTYDATAREHTITWENSEASNYLIQVVDKVDAYPRFQSINLVPTEEGTNTFSAKIGLGTLKWFGNIPKDGEELLVVVHAFNSAGSNVLGEFIAGKKFVWGKAN